MFVTGFEEGVDLIIISNSSAHTAYRDLWRHFLELRTGDRQGWLHGRLERPARGWEIGGRVVRGGWVNLIIIYPFPPVRISVTR